VRQYWTYFLSQLLTTMPWAYPLALAGFLQLPYFHSIRTRRSLFVSYFYLFPTVLA
jgi:hypothetical protein